MTIKIIHADITQLAVDAIVNAANESLLAGGGVCGAIHRAAGRELEAACQQLGRCPTGKALLTLGFNLKAMYVIHAVGPRWYDGTRGEADLLERCYRSIFEIVFAQKFTSVALPAISTGLYHFPLDAATRIAIRVAREYDTAEREITFACFDEGVVRVYEDVLHSLEA